MVLGIIFVFGTFLGIGATVFVFGLAGLLRNDFLPGATNNSNEQERISTYDRIPSRN